MHTQQTESSTVSLSGPPPASWPASWIAHPSAASAPTGVYCFRRSFDLAAVPADFRVRVSADNRYHLYVNGSRVSSGPARGDLLHWRYETLDLAPMLRPGRNVIAAVVWWLPTGSAPWAQMGHAPAFIVCAEPGPSEAKGVNTPDGWRCYRDGSYSFPAEQNGLNFGVVVGPGEHMDGKAHPWGWERLEFDDSGWSSPARIADGTPRGARDGPGPWILVRSQLPPMEERSFPVTSIVRVGGSEAGGKLLGAENPLTVPANHTVKVLLDNRVLTTGYPELTVSGGDGAAIRLRYSEALYDPRGQKTNRDTTTGMEMRGYFDVFLPDGQRRVYRPLYWRTFRYLQLEIETAGQPLTVHGLANAFTAYPFEERGSFTASDDSLRKVWEVGWRTARLCAHETYMDCPYWEQLQYGGDTRIQCLVSLYVSGDDRLMRNAILQLEDSRIPEGITQSRYPCWNTQIIPPFALWWIGMIHDFWMFRDDAAFVRGRLSGARGTIEWFIDRLRPDGLLGPLPWWNFVDWAREFPAGVPPGADEGGSAILTLQLMLALQEMAAMEHALGLPANAHRYSQLARLTGEAVRRECWDSGRGLLADTPKRDRFSQHANTLAILTGTITGARARAVGEILGSAAPAASAGRGRPQMAAATFYFRFYLHRALRKVGLGERYLEWLQPWRDMLALGLTTWAEQPEPTRSDCHAWSAHPNVGLLDTVLGVEPGEPGFRSVTITPHLGPLSWADGVVPHPAGPIAVKLRRRGTGLDAEIQLPDGVPGVFRYGGKAHELKPGGQDLQAR